MSKPHAEAYWRAFATGVHGKYLFLVLEGCKLHAIARYQFNLRAIWLVSWAAQSQRRLVFLWFPVTNPPLKYGIFGWWLVNHVGHPGVPSRESAVERRHFSMRLLLIPAWFYLCSVKIQHQLNGCQCQIQGLTDHIPCPYSPPIVSSLRSTVNCASWY